MVTKVTLGLVALAALVSCEFFGSQPFGLPGKGDRSEEPRRPLVVIKNDEVALLDGSDGARVRTLVPAAENIGLAWDRTRKLVIVGRSNGSFVELTNSTVFTVDVEGKKQVQILKTKGEVEDVEISPSGDSLAVTSWNHRRTWLHVVHLDSDKRETWPIGGQVSWAPDGRHLAFVADNENGWGIKILDTNDGSQRSLRIEPHRDGEVWGAPIFRPDGRLIVTSSCCIKSDRLMPKGASPQLVVDVATGDVLRKLPRFPHRAHLIDYSAEGKPLFMGDRQCGDHSCSGQLYVFREGEFERLSSYVFTADW